MKRHALTHPKSMPYVGGDCPCRARISGMERIKEAAGFVWCAVAGFGMWIVGPVAVLYLVDSCQSAFGG